MLHYVAPPLYSVTLDSDSSSQYTSEVYGKPAAQSGFRKDSGRGDSSRVARRHASQGRKILSPVTVLDLSADIGLVAVFFATLNICIGLMIWGRYSPVRYWPHRRFDIFRVHRWSGYITLGATLLHPLPLLLSHQPAFRVLDILLPLWSPQQPLENTIGAAALYLLVII